LEPGVSFINGLCAAFTLADPKSAKTDSLTVFLHFWDLHMQKGACKMLMKLTPSLVVNQLVVP